MNVIMDGMLIAGTLFAGIYCMILSRRVQALKSLDSGLGGSIVSLTRQIELARTTLEEARAATGDNHRDLGDLVARSESAAAQLRLMLVATKERTARPAPRAPQRAARPAEPVEKPSARPDAAADAAAAPRPAASPEPDAAAASVTISTRRRDSLGPRLVTLPATALTWPAEADPQPDYVPKPRRSAPSLDALLRGRAPFEEDAPQSEEDLMAALGAIAAGGDR